MKLNVGTVDQVIRAVLGLLLLYIGLAILNGLSGAILGLIVGLAGLVLLVTSFMRWCPIYFFLGVSTCKKE